MVVGKAECKPHGIKVKKVAHRRPVPCFDQLHQITRILGPTWIVDLQEIHRSGQVHQRITDPRREAEINQSRHPQIVIHHHIRRPDVAVNNAFDRVRQGQQSRRQTRDNCVQTGHIARQNLVGCEPLQPHRQIFPPMGAPHWFRHQQIAVVPLDPHGCHRLGNGKIGRQRRPAPRAVQTGHHLGHRPSGNPVLNCDQRALDIPDILHTRHGKRHPGQTCTERRALPDSRLRSRFGIWYPQDPGLVQAKNVALPA